MRIWCELPREKPSGTGRYQTKNTCPGRVLGLQRCEAEGAGGAWVPTWRVMEADECLKGERATGKYVENNARGIADCF